MDTCKSGLYLQKICPSHLRITSCRYAGRAAQFTLCWRWYRSNNLKANGCLQILDGVAGCFERQLFLFLSYWSDGRRAKSPPPPLQQYQTCLEGFSCHISKCWRLGIYLEFTQKFKGEQIARIKVHKYCLFSTARDTILESMCKKWAPNHHKTSPKTNSSTLGLNPHSSSNGNPPNLGEGEGLEQPTENRGDSIPS